jgi:hypothetical protein
MSGADRPALSVRPARPGYAAAIAEVHVRTWQAAYRGQIPDAFLDGLSVERHHEAWRANLRAAGFVEARLWLRSSVARWLPSPSSRRLHHEPLARPAAAYRTVAFERLDGE